MEVDPNKAGKPTDIVDGPSKLRDLIKQRQDKLLKRVLFTAIKRKYRPSFRRKFRYRKSFRKPRYARRTRYYRR